MKVESLVIVDEHATVNLYLSLVLTARHAVEINQMYDDKHNMLGYDNWGAFVAKL